MSTLTCNVCNNDFPHPGAGDPDWCEVESYLCPICGEDALADPSEGSRIRECWANGLDTTAPPPKPPRKRKERFGPWEAPTENDVRIILENVRRDRVLRALLLMKDKPVVSKQFAYSIAPPGPRPMDAEERAAVMDIWINTPRDRYRSRIHRPKPKKGWVGVVEETCNAMMVQW